MSGPLPPEGFRTRGVTPVGARLVLIRHGEARCNERGVVGGPLGCGGLTQLGRRQALELRDRLERTRELRDAGALYTSLLPRAIQTAAILAPGLPDLTPESDCDLCELHPGEADGLTWDELVARFGAPDWDEDASTPLAPGAESWTGFYERCVAALTRLVARHPGERVVVVTHGGVIEQAMKLLYGATPGTRLRLLTENCSMTEIEFDRGRLRLLRYNDLAPVPIE